MRIENISEKEGECLCVRHRPRRQTLLWHAALESARPPSQCLHGVTTAGQRCLNLSLPLLPVFSAGGECSQPA